MAKTNKVDPAVTLKSAGIGMVIICAPIWVTLALWGRVFGGASEGMQMVTFVVLVIALVFGALLGLDVVERRLAK